MFYVLYKDISNIKESDLSIYPSFLFKRSNKYRDDFRRLQSKVSYAILYDSLKKHFNITLKGKDLDLNNLSLNVDNLYFSIAHSKNLVVVAISNTNIGVDIECIDHLKEKYHLAPKILNEVEYKHFLRITPKYKPYYYTKCWTRKESFVKYKHTLLNSFVFKKDLSMFDYEYYHIIDNLKNEYIICLCKSFA